MLGENNREYIHHLPNLSKRSKSVVWSTFFWLELRPRLGPWASALLNLLHCCLRERESANLKDTFCLLTNKYFNKDNDNDNCGLSELASLKDIYLAIYQTHISTKPNSFTNDIQHWIVTSSDTLNQAEKLINHEIFEVTNDHAILFHKKTSPFFNQMGESRRKLGTS